jgi:delta 1-pyrroline-5-carboxylate dehydrogenase
MIKSILLILCISFSFSLLGQTNYPIFEKDSSGNDVIIMTVEQAQKLDNLTDLLFWFEKLNLEVAEYDSICLKIISSKDKLIMEQYVQINILKEAVDYKNTQISELKEMIINREEAIVTLESQLDKSKEIEDIYQKEIHSLKTKMLVGGSISGISLIGLILGIIAIK